MREVLKQRLVGALVIIALGVIFWPLIFVDVDRPPLDRTTQVPPMPAFDRDQIPTPEPLDDVPKAVPVEKAIVLHESPPTAVEESSEEQARSEQPQLDEEGIPVAWVLQVITVSSRDKADSLRAQLIAMQLKAYHRPVKRDEQTLYRLYVGPLFDRARLDEIRLQVDEQLKVDSIVARYKP